MPHHLHLSARPMSSFPIIEPVTDDERVLGAWKFARQKWALEEQAVAELDAIRAARAPHSVIEAAERAVAYAEDRTGDAIALLFDEYRFQREKNRPRITEEALTNESERLIA